MKLDCEKILKEISIDLEEEEEICLETIEELTDGRGEDEDEQ